MAALGSQSIASSYEQLLHVDADGGGNGSTLVNVKDGDNGTTFALQLASDNIKVSGSSDLDGAVTINESSADVDFRVESNGNANMLFVDGGNDRVGIGTDSPADKLELAGSNGNVQIDAAGQTLTFTRNDANYIKTTGSVSKIVVVAESGGVQLLNEATSWSSASDERLKDVIEPITGAIGKIEQIRPIIGKYKTDKEGTRRSMLIAQDVEKVFPEVVYTTTEDTEEKNEYLSLAYTELIPLLLGAIQELSAKVEALEG